jgi:hypothetical protein
LRKEIDADIQSNAPANADDEVAEPQPTASPDEQPSSMKKKRGPGH